ncbi:MAG: hypothetical protein ACE5E5_11285 [Phycisphaerae bacterium]
MSDFDHEQPGSPSPTGAPRLDGVERIMLDVASAERAGVFRDTSVSPQSLQVTTPPVSAPPVQLFGLSRRQAAMWLTPIAAAVVLAVGLGGYMFRIELDAIRQRRDAIIAQSTAPAAGPASDCDGDFLRCCYGKSVTGLASRCAAYDRNGDGMIDLFDYQAYQIDYGQAVRNN